MKLLRSFSVYAASTFLNKGIGLLLMPIFSYYLTKKDYGTLSLINTFVAVLAPLILIQVKGAISVEFYRSNSSQDFRNYFVSSLINPIVSFCFFLIIFLIFQGQIANYFELEKFWIMMVPLMVIVTLFPQLSQALFQVNKKPIAFGIFANSKTIFELGLSLLLIIAFSLNYEGRLYAIAFNGFLFTIIAIYLIWKQNYFNGSLKMKFRKDALLFGLPLIPHAIGAIVVNASDRFFIAKMVSLDDLGLYSFGYTIGSIIMIIEIAFTQAWTPFFYEQMKIDSDESRKKIVKAGYAFVIFMIVALCILTFVAPLLFKYVFDDKFSGASVYVFWVGLGYVFLGVYKIFAGFIFYLKRTNILARLSIVNVSLNLILNFYLIGKFGALGAAYATAISFLLLLLFTMIISMSIYPMKWTLR